MSLFERIFSPVKKYQKTVNLINAAENGVVNLSNDELKDKSLRIKEKIRKGELSLEDALVDAFALSREAAKRTLKQRHYDVQLIGGITLFEGKISEMATGEGKTLAATAPAYLHGLSGKGSISSPSTIIWPSAMPSGWAKFIMLWGSPFPAWCMMPLIFTTPSGT